MEKLRHENQCRNHLKTLKMIKDRVKPGTLSSKNPNFYWFNPRPFQEQLSKEHSWSDLLTQPTAPDLYLTAPLHLGCFQANSLILSPLQARSAPPLLSTESQPQCSSWAMQTLLWPSKLQWGSRWNLTSELSVLTEGKLGALMLS